MINQSINLKFL